MNSKSEEYFTTKLEKEFNSICKELRLKSTITREEMFELFVKMGYLKSIEQLKSIFVAEENIQQFVNISKKIEMSSEDRYEIASVKAFIFALNNLWRYIDRLIAL